MHTAVDNTWDFRYADTKIMTHGFHAYPAIMIPQIARRLLTQFAPKQGNLFDPYCGTGTSLVEGRLHNLNVIGTDLNPLARLISQAKTTVLNTQVLDLFLKDFNDFLFSLRFNNPTKILSIEIPTFKNVDFWFHPKTIEELSIIRSYIRQISDKDIKNFFHVCFSETVRDVSLTRKGEFKLYRMPPKVIEQFMPDTFEIMLRKLARNRVGYSAFHQSIPPKTNCTIFDFDSCSGVPQDKIPEKSVDIVVTSPPYGDSRTTVAYGQFSRLANEWLDLPNASQIDNLLMGGRKKIETTYLEFKPLNKILTKIKKIDSKRANEVSAFYCDLQNSIANVSKTVKNGGYICYVVGNRKVKGTVLPTAEFVKDVFEKTGATHKMTIVRNIPNKRMPSKNSPSNMSGVLDSTMTNEYIVVMRK